MGWAQQVGSGNLPAMITDDMPGSTFCNAFSRVDTRSYPSQETDELAALSVVYGSYRISEMHFMRQVRR